MVETQCLEWEGREIRYTISCGITDLDSDIDSHESWLQRADKALYHANENGRNRVTLFQDI